MGRLPRPTYCTRPVPYAALLPWPPHRTAPLPTLALDEVPDTTWHARTKGETGGKVIHTYYSEHAKQDIIGDQRITHHAPYQSQQRGRNAGRIPWVES